MFIAENLVLSENREELIAYFGQETYQYTYATLSTVAMGSVCYGCIRHGRGARLWELAPLGTRTAGFTLQAMGLAGFAQLVPRLQSPVTQSEELDDAARAEQSARGPSNRRDSITERQEGWKVQCPMDFKGEANAGVPDGEEHGLTRITRHPTMWCLATLGLGTALVTPFAAQAVMCTMPAVFAVIGGAHVDMRHRRGSGGTLTPERDARTSNVPFLAFVQGQQSWARLVEELKWTNVAAATAAAALLWKRRHAVLAPRASRLRAGGERDTSMWKEARDPKTRRL